MITVGELLDRLGFVQGSRCPDHRNTVMVDFSGFGDLRGMAVERILVNQHTLYIVAQGTDERPRKKGKEERT